MTTQRILIVEDEPIIARDLSYMITDFGYEVVAIVHSAKEAMDIMSDKSIDLVILDINLAGNLTGIDLAHWINKKLQLPFIFLTSYSDQITLEKAKITEPYGYLVKPINEHNLKSTLEIAHYNYQIRQKKEIPEQEENFWLGNDFFIKKKGELIKVSVPDILFAEANDNYTLIHTEQQKFIISATLKKVEEKLTSLPFYRIHRSYLINLKRIDKVTKDEVHLGEHCLPISKKHKDGLYKIISTL